MNTTQLEFQARAGGRSQNEKLARFLERHPNVWLEMPALAQVITPTGIGAAVHSRVADCRKLGMNIEHRNEKKAGDGLVHSFYKYVPGDGAQGTARPTSSNEQSTQQPLTII